MRKTPTSKITFGTGLCFSSWTFVFSVNLVVGNGRWLFLMSLLDLCFGNLCDLCGLLVFLQVGALQYIAHSCHTDLLGHLQAHLCEDQLELLLLGRVQPENTIHPVGRMDSKLLKIQKSLVLHSTTI